MKARNNLIDFHAHIIPGADHGSSKYETTKKQLELLLSVGIGEVVATPHFYPHQTLLEDFLARRDACIELMKEILTPESPIIYPAAEVLLTPNLDTMSGLDKLCVKGTNVLLVEIPSLEFDTEMLNTLSNTKENGFEVIVAHVDRYPAEIAETLLEFGFKCQLNAESISAPIRRKKILKYFSKGDIVAIGTDIHGENVKFVNGYKKACDILGSRLDSIMTKSRELLCGAESIN